MIPRTNPSTVSIPLRTKITLLIFGFFLFLIFLEAGLRLGGFMILSLQEYRNLQSIQQKGTYRIMCLGESTTAGKWPPFLEKALNQRHTGIQFSVIDKGVAGTNSSVILAQLESNLTQYHPDMVVTMMGVNDGGVYAPYEAASCSASIRFLRSFRTYKLARLLWLHILTKAREVGFYKSSEAKQYLRKIKSYLLVGGLKEAYAGQTISGSTESTLKKAVELNPQNDEAYVELGACYLIQGKFSQAESTLKKAVELNPQNDEAYVELGRVYHTQGKFSQEEDSLKKAIALNPQSGRAYAQLGQFYKAQDNFSRAEDALKKAIALNPQNDGVYLELGSCYLTQDNFSQAEDTLKKAVEVNPKGDRAYVELGWCYRKQGKLSRAEDAFKKAIELNPQSDEACGALSVLYVEAGKPELAKEYDKMTKRLRLGYYTLPMVNNYRKLKEVLDKRGIKLVCAQYPMRSIEPLKRIFEGNEKGVIFVDNKKVFRDAVKKDGYTTYFVDMFGGDFGHCTDKGNRLLAENIANVILKEVLNK